MKYKYTYFAVNKLAERSLTYEIVKGEMTPAIVRDPSKRIFQFRGHFHSGYSTIGDSRNNCMSTARYQD
jgi:hypothetical protein